MATISGTSGNDSLVGVGEGDFFVGTSGNDTLTGAAVSSGVGNAKNQNLVDYSGLTGPVTVDISAGTVDKGADGTDAISGIAQVRGTNGADSLAGDGDRNWFWGLGGNDTLNGLATGDDNDRAIYSLDPGGVTVNLSTGTATDGFGGTDTLVEIEIVHGSLFDDNLTGDSGFNTLVGLKGNDTLDGGSTGDAVAFTGIDEVDYRFEEGATEQGFRGVDLDLAAGTATDTYGTTDTLIRIESVTGSRFVDTLRGGATDDFLQGMQGNDIIDGGDGADQAVYFRSEAAIRFNGSRGYAFDGFGSRDSVTSIEQVQGSDFDDVIFAAGLTFIKAGSGTDSIVFSGAQSAYSISISGTSATVSGGSEGSVTVLDAENLFFTGALVNAATGVADTSQAGARPLDLSGTDASDALAGGSGADYAIGGSGADTIDAGAGDDLVYGNKQLDLLVGGAGNDTLFGGQNDGTERVGSHGAGPLALRDGIDTLSGGDGDDLLYGNHGSDSMDGGAGADTLFGGQDDDTLIGGAGADLLIGNLGGDFLQGDGGGDRYVVSGADTISGFDQSEGDLIESSAGRTGVVDGADGAVVSFGDGSSVTLLGVPASEVTDSFFV